MPVTDIAAAMDGPRLNIRWTNPVIAGHAITVQVSKSLEFIGALRSFVMPMTSGAGLDLGVGPWFFRIGIWSGSPQTGILDWSGIYGPYETSSLKIQVPIRPSPVKILHTQAITHGIRFHTGMTTPYYVMVDVSKDNEGYGAGVTTSQYSYDVGRGYFDIGGLDYSHTYNFRIFAFLDELGTIPHDTVKMMGLPMVVAMKRPGRQLRQLESGVSTARKAEDTILKDLARQPKLTFNSHADYLKYVAAKARSSEEVRAHGVRP